MQTVVCWAQELVDFLEETIGVSDDEAKGKASSSTSTSASASAAGGSSGSGNGGPGGASGSGAGANGSGAGSNGSGAAANGQRGGPAGSSSGGKGAATDYTNTDFYKKYEDAYSTFQKFEETLGGSAAGNGSRWVHWGGRGGSWECGGQRLISRISGAPSTMT